MGYSRRLYFAFTVFIVLAPLNDFVVHLDSPYRKVTRTPSLSNKDPSIQSGSLGSVNYQAKVENKQTNHRWHLDLQPWITGWGPSPQPS